LSSSNSSNNSNQLISVGIDIGTTTTHLIVSKLSFANVSLVNAAPNLAISGREILHESAIYATPLTDDGEIEASLVAQIIAEAYSAAGLEKSTIQTGALIITGQSARARNAEAVSASLAALAGDFVIESAGPHLESILAARGSLAVEYSAQSDKTVLNIDIGGGTSNFALICRGKIVDSACLNIGGRMVQFDFQSETGTNRTNRTIKAISESGQLLGQNQIKKGQSADLDVLKTLAQQGAALILQVAQGAEILLSQVMLTENLSHDLIGHDLSGIDEIWLSGGVASAFTEENLFRYDDLGVLLARALEELLRAQQITFQISPRAIRATVIGAGLHTLQLSGSTIGFEQNSRAMLPLRNVKIIKLPLLSSDSATDLSFEATIGRQLKQREHDWSKEAVCLVLSGITRDMLSFKFLDHLAQKLSDSFLSYKGREPLVIVSDADLAMALRLLLQGRLTDKRIITVDGINAEEGDYIDIGTPVSSSSDPNTQSLPVVVKTLVFYKSPV